MYCQVFGERCLANTELPHVLFSIVCRELEGKRTYIHFVVFKCSDVIMQHSVTVLSICYSSIMQWEYSYIDLYDLQWILNHQALLMLKLSGTSDCEHFSPYSKPIP